MKKIGLIAGREFMAAVMNRGFLIGLLMMPVLGGLFLIAAPRIFNPGRLDVRGEMAIVDSTGLVIGDIRKALDPSTIAARRDEDARQALASVPAVARQVPGGNQAVARPARSAGEPRADRARVAGRRSSGEALAQRRASDAAPRRGGHPCRRGDRDPGRRPRHLRFVRRRQHRSRAWRASFRTALRDALDQRARSRPASRSRAGRGASCASRVRAPSSSTSGEERKHGSWLQDRAAAGAGRSHAVRHDDGRPDAADLHHRGKVEPRDRGAAVGGVAARVDGRQDPRTPVRQPARGDGLHRPRHPVAGVALPSSACSIPG